MWALGVLFIWMTALTIFRRYRRRTKDYAQWKIYKSRTPKWVRNFEYYLGLLLRHDHISHLGFVGCQPGQLVNPEYSQG